MDGELKAAFNDGEGATVDGELDEDDIDAMLQEVRNWDYKPVLENEREN